MDHYSSLTASWLSRRTQGLPRSWDYYVNNVHEQRTKQLLQFSHFGLVPVLMYGGSREKQHGGDIRQKTITDTEKSSLPAWMIASMRHSSVVRA